MAARNPGVVYLIHFDAPIGDTSLPTGYARHYTGSARDLAARLDKHAAGEGARLMAVVREQNIGWHVSRTWPGGRVRERQIKRQGGASRYCPTCKGQPLAPELADFRMPGTAAVPKDRAWHPEPKPPARCEPLENSIAIWLTETEQAALLHELNAAESDAWHAFGEEYGRGNPRAAAWQDLACDLSRLRNDEARAIERLPGAQTERRAVSELAARIADTTGRQQYPAPQPAG